MKSIPKPAYERFVTIDDRISRNTYPNCSKLAVLFEVSVRTVSRDIEYLKDRLYAPIEFSVEKNGYYYTNNYRIPNIEHLSEGEFLSMCLAEKAIEQYRNTPFHSELNRIFDKLKTMLPSEISVKSEYLGSHFSIVPESTAIIPEKIWETMSHAAIHHHQVHIVYRRAGSDIPRERIFDCYHIFGYKGGWFAIGYCHLRKEIRTFSLSRIDKIELLASEFIVKNEFNLSKELSGNFGIATGKEKYKVEILFSKGVASQIEERTWHPEQNVKKQKLGEVILTFPTRSFVEILPWVLSWGKDAVVLKPKELREMVIDEIKFSIHTYTNAK